jgi:hypothetical protein
MHTSIVNFALYARFFIFYKLSMNHYSSHNYTTLLNHQSNPHILPLVKTKHQYCFSLNIIALSVA